MDSDDALVGTILTRRQALLAAARVGAIFAAGGVATRAARAASAPTTHPKLSLVASPALTEGPFFVDEKLNRSDLLAGTNRAEVVDGLPLLLTFTVYKLGAASLAPLAGVQVDLWNADISGAYSDESDPMNHQNTAGQRWLRGYQLTDTAGIARFRTIIPGWYNGRAPHIHFKVRQFDDRKASVLKEFTSQVFFTDADRRRIYAQRPYETFADGGTTNDQDMVYTQPLSDGSPAGKLMTLALHSAATAKGYSADFAMALNDQNLLPGGGEHGPRRFGNGGMPPPPPPDDDVPWW